jgi:hypothetical protein
MDPVFGMSMDRDTGGLKAGSAASAWYFYRFEGMLALFHVLQDIEQDDDERPQRPWRVRWTCPVEAQ